MGSCYGGWRQNAIRKNIREGDYRKISVTCPGLIQLRIFLRGLTNGGAYIRWGGGGGSYKRNKKTVTKRATAVLIGIRFLS